jgi:hypothetical protein
MKLAKHTVAVSVEAYYFTANVRNARAVVGQEI